MLSLYPNLSADSRAQLVFRKYILGDYIKVWVCMNSPSFFSYLSDTNQIAATSVALNFKVLVIIQDLGEQPLL